MNKIQKRLIKLIIFFLIINLPFVTIIQIIGIDAFLDSFKNPNLYNFLATDIYSTNTNTEEKYVLLQKSSCPTFSIDNGDTILYCTDQGKTACTKVNQIKCTGPIKRYETIDENADQNPIYETQIYGKVLGFVDNNPWTILSIKIWEISTHTANLNTFFANN